MSRILVGDRVRFIRSTTTGDQWLRGTIESIELSDMIPWLTIVHADGIRTLLQATPESLEEAQFRVAFRDYEKQTEAERMRA